MLFHNETHKMGPYFDILRSCVILLVFHELNCRSIIRKNDVKRPRTDTRAALYSERLREVVCRRLDKMKREEKEK